MVVAKEYPALFRIEVSMKNLRALRLCFIISAILMVVPNGTAFAQDLAAVARTNRARAAAESGGEGAIIKVKCVDEANVIVTADSARGLPLNTVATLKCDEEIKLLSDPQDYTVKVRTADGIVGYVLRYEIVIVPAIPQPVAASADATSNSVPSGNAAQAATETSPQRTATDSSKPRVYVSDTQSWTASGGFGRASSIPEGKLYGGYDPELTDVYQGFTSNCAAVVVTQEKSKANYAVLFGKGTSKKGITGLGGLVKVNKVTVITLNGETVFSQAAHSADTAVSLACEAITQRSASQSAGQTHP